MSDTILCPKCKAEHEPSCEYADGDILHCRRCDFPFHLSIDYSPDYATECVEHDWSVWRCVTDGSVWFRFCNRCDKCDASRTAPEGVNEQVSP